MKIDVKDKTTWQGMTAPRFKVSINGEDVTDRCFYADDGNLLNGGFVRLYKSVDGVCPYLNRETGELEIEECHGLVLIEKGNWRSKSATGLC